MKRHAWVRVEDAPADPEPLADFLLFAIIGTWCEGDVVDSTVKNAFVQGCQEVYLVDNISPDNTVERAVSAGAKVARLFESEFYNEPLRIHLMNEVVQQRSEASGAQHVWWLWLDADEFPHGPAGTTIWEYLATLDRRYRIVGSRTFNHYPDRKPEMLPGFHPLDCQPLCEERWMQKRSLTCTLGHWKHQLQRFDRGGPMIHSLDGFHAARCKDVLSEPSTPIIMHHFPYRDEATTRERLARLCSKRSDGPTRAWFDNRLLGASNALKRFHSLNAVYAGQWSKVDNERHDLSLGVQPRSWLETADPADLGFARWYSEEYLANAIRAQRDEGSATNLSNCATRLPINGETARR